MLSAATLMDARIGEDSLNFCKNGDVLVEKIIEVLMFRLVFRGGECTSKPKQLTQPERVALPNKLIDSGEFRQF